MTFEQLMAAEQRRAMQFADFLAALGEPKSNVVQFPRDGSEPNKPLPSDK